MPATQLDQALEGVKAIAGLGAGAIIIFVVYRFAGVVLTDARSRAPGGYGGIRANDWIMTGLDIILPATFVFLVFFGLLAAAIFSRRY